MLQSCERNITFYKGNRSFQCFQLSRPIYWITMKILGLPLLKANKTNTSSSPSQLGILNWIEQYWHHEHRKRTKKIILRSPSYLIYHSKIHVCREVTVVCQMLTWHVVGDSQRNVFDSHQISPLRKGQLDRLQYSNCSIQISLDRERSKELGNLCPALNL